MSEILITPLGLQRSKRNANDGFAYFGSKRKSFRTNNEKFICNDYVMS